MTLSSTFADDSIIGVIKRYPRSTIVAALLCVLFLLSQVTPSEYSTTQRTFSADTSERPPEENLAIINNRGAVRRDDITIVRFRFLVNELSKSSGETPGRVADMLVVAHKMIAEEYGKKVTLLEFTEAAYQTRHLVEDGSMRLPNMLVYLAVLTGTM